MSLGPYASSLPRVPWAGDDLGGTAYGLERAQTLTHAFERWPRSRRRRALLLLIAAAIAMQVVLALLGGPLLRSVRRFRSSPAPGRGCSTRSSVARWPLRDGCDIGAGSHVFGVANESEWTTAKHSLRYLELAD